MTHDSICDRSTGICYAFGETGPGKEYNTNTEYPAGSLECGISQSGLEQATPEVDLRGACDQNGKQNRHGSSTGQVSKYNSRRVKVPCAPSLVGHGQIL